ncbi:FAGR116Wp [Eremothecium gossypii FDAG1]|nr:FAGR116Wp [Eremothecium gossypii FDAG1]
MPPSTPQQSKKVMQMTPGKKRLKQATLMSFFKKGMGGTSPAAGAEPQRGAAVETSTPCKAEQLQLFVEDASDEGETTFVTAHDDGAVKEEGATQVESQGSARRRRSVSYAEESDDEDVVAVRRKTRRMAGDDEDAEFVPERGGGDKDASMLLEDDDDILELAAKPRTAQPRRPAPPPARRPPAVRPVRDVSPGKHSNFSKNNEERYQWLVDERDAAGRSPSDPEYDPRTLHIPAQAWARFTPFEKQYWQIKSKMWDCIVFFKKGKFFELYEKDAHLANQLFDLKIAGGGRANMQLAGIPEMSFDYWASQFIQHGYKVAKVDQKESMLAKEMREGNKGIVERELQCVLSGGTLTDLKMLHSDQSTYCLSIHEAPLALYAMERGEAVPPEAQQQGRLFGTAFIDTATGRICLLEFEDDSECTQLDTLMAQVRPKEVVMEKRNLSVIAHKIVKFNSQPDCIFNYRTSAEFYDYARTFDEVSNGGYFAGMDSWPAILKQYYDQGKKVGFSAFGGLLSYLQWLKLDKSLLSMGMVEEYNPLKAQTSLVLDGITLQNLEIFANSFDGTDKGTLFKLVNRAITPMGKRQMRTWVMHPLLRKEHIEERLDSVDQLLNEMPIRDLLESSLTGLPDLERLLARVHSGNLPIKDFDKVICGFENIVRLISSLNEYELSGSLSRFLHDIPSTLKSDVESWTTLYDRNMAVSEGKVVPNAGVEPDFDVSLSKMRALEEELDAVLSEYKRSFKCSKIQYKDSGKELYTIELPISIAKSVPSNWTQLGANKSTKRYYSPKVQKLARSMAEARELHKILEEGLKGRLYQKFDQNFSTTWFPTIKAISNIDCILSLARTSESLGFPACRPNFKDEIDPTTGHKLNGYLSFKELRHPCYNAGVNGATEFIPNDVHLGKSTAQIALLTGANAAGKSTILRMTCIAVIMAQLGCYVPCEDAELSPMDRIMTRLGANDNIMQGKSTFFVELSETRKILDMATNRTLIVLDELGRGGSSSDGFAIAEGVLHHISTHVQSLGFFATHYGTLGQSFTHHPMVKPLQMAILVDEGSKKVTFLYKLIEGQSEGSFGMHVAAMCGIPRSVVENAERAAESFEHTSRILKERKRYINDEHVVPLGLQSDFVRLVFGDGLKKTALGSGEGVKYYDKRIKANVLRNIISMVDGLNQN